MGFACFVWSEARVFSSGGGCVPGLTFMDAGGFVGGFVGCFGRFGFVCAWCGHCLVGFAWVCELAGFLVSCVPGPCQASEKSGFARFVRCLWVSKFCPFWCLSLCCWFDGFNFVPVLATCW